MSVCSLSPRLYRKCYNDAHKFCNVENWDTRFPRGQDDAQPDSFVFSCLYQNLKEDKVWTFTKALIPGPGIVLVEFLFG